MAIHEAGKMRAHGGVHTTQGQRDRKGVGTRLQRRAGRDAYDCVRIGDTRLAPLQELVDDGVLRGGDFHYCSALPIHNAPEQVLDDLQVALGCRPVRRTGTQKEGAITHGNTRGRGRWHGALNLAVISRAMKARPRQSVNAVNV